MTLEPGMKVGMLLLTRKAAPDGTQARFWARCDCGNLTVLHNAGIYAAIKFNTNISCGCLGKDNRIDYGNRQRAVDEIWLQVTKKRNGK